MNRKQTSSSQFIIATPLITACMADFAALFHRILVVWKEIFIAVEKVGLRDLFWFESHYIYIGCFFFSVGKLVDFWKAPSRESEDSFEIESVSWFGEQSVGHIELKAILPDGKNFGWEPVPYKTLIGCARILIIKYPRDWPRIEGIYKLIWRCTTWGNPPLVKKSAWWSLS